MNRLVFIMFCIVLFTPYACTREDLSSCPPPVNSYLTFSYTGDDNNPEMFHKMIDHVTLIIYDETGKRVTDRKINKGELNQWQGTKLSLNPGSYRAVCWGNADNNTEITDHESLANGRIHHPFYASGAEIETNSHLYYGTYAFSVPSAGIAEGNIPFRGAHINVEVYIRSDAVGTGRYVVKAHNLMPQYDHDMVKAQDFATTYHPQTTYNAERTLDECIFQTLRFNNNNPIVIEVKQTSGETLTIDLEQYMQKSGITVDGKNEATVPILIEYSDLGVVLKIPEWLQQIVTPGV